jgi:hypothetical protein
MMDVQSELLLHELARAGEQRILGPIALLKSPLVLIPAHHLFIVAPAAVVGWAQRNGEQVPAAPAAAQ